MVIFELIINIDVARYMFMNDKKQVDKGKSHTKRYLIWLLLVLIVVDLIDSYSTNYITAVTSSVVTEFLVTPYGIPETTALALFSLCSGLATLGMYVVFFNQYLADKFGRKKLLAFVTFGMGLGSLLLFFSFDIFSFTIFLFIMYIFFSSDAWIIYANEESSDEKRALWTNVILAAALLGPVFMAVFRPIFVTNAPIIEAWRGMTLLPIILGFTFTVVIIFTVKETSKYEEIKEEGALDKRDSIFMKQNLRAVLNSPRKNEVKIILIMSIFNGLNYGFTILTEVFLKTHSTLTESQINTTIYIIAGSVAIGYIFTGVLCDKIGRKPMLYAHSIILPIGVILSVIGALTSSFLIVALGAALGYAGFWGLNVVIRLVIIEIVPTEQRGTAGGLRALSWAVGATIGLLVGSLLIYTTNPGVSFIILSLPVILNIVLASRHLKETKGVNLSEI